MILSGDRHCDSPGKSAKYCTYSMMENQDNLILQTVTLDKRHAQLKSNMERMALVNCLQYIIDKGVNVTEVITDASTSVTSDLCQY